MIVLNDVVEKMTTNPMIQHYVKKCQFLSEQTPSGHTVVHIVTPAPHVNDCLGSFYALPRIEDAIQRTLGTDQFTIKFILRKDKADEGKQVWS